MAFKLSTKPHSFATFIALISVVLFHAMCAHVRVRIPFVFIFIITMFAVEPASFRMRVHVSVKVPYVFKLPVTFLFRAQ